MAQQRENPEAQLAAKLKRLRDQHAELGSGLLFADELDRVSRRESRLQEMAASLAKLRGRGYAFAADLEPLLESARAAAGEAIAGARVESELAADLLRKRIDRAGVTVRALSAARTLEAHHAELESLEKELEALDRATAEARQKIDAVTRPFTKPFDDLEKKLRALHLTLDRFDARSFDMTPEEAPLAAFEATWKDSTAGEEMDGLLLLSDHRLRFEQREEKVTKRKFLIFAAEKEKIQKCWIDEPIGHLTSSDDSTEGWLLKDQLLTLSWSGAAKAPPKTTFEIDGARAKEVDELVERVLGGDIERDRFTGGGQVAASAPVKWPEECSDCGAKMVPPVKGQTRISCTYCGHTYQL